MAKFKGRANQSKAKIEELPEDDNKLVREDNNKILRVGPSKRKNAVCPKCNAFPTITKIRRKNYELRRCKECGLTFEIKGDI